MLVPTAETRFSGAARVGPSLCTTPDERSMGPCRRNGCVRGSAAAQFVRSGYKHDPSKQRPGFLIDDNEPSEAVDPARDMVDLYGYTSRALAALQVQARELEALRREVAELRRAQRHSGGARRSSQR